MKGEYEQSGTPRDATAAARGRGSPGAPPRRRRASGRMFILDRGARERERQGLRYPGTGIRFAGLLDPAPLVRTQALASQARARRVAVGFAVVFAVGACVESTSASGACRAGSVER